MKSASIPASANFFRFHDSRKNPRASAKGCILITSRPVNEVVVTSIVMSFVYLALGSNLGDREQHLRSGISGLAARGVEIVQSASIYSTEPRDVLDQPWFLNTVLKTRTNLPPDRLLQTCLDVEQENGRLRDRDKGPRT